MELEVAVPVPPVDFNFDSNCSSPYITAPSSPQRFPNFFISAPTSPSSASAILKSRSPTFHGVNGGNEDFEFDFSGHLQRTSLSAEELFDGGKIRPLKPPHPPPRLQSGDRTDSSSPRMSKGKKVVQEKRDSDFDTCESGLEKTRKGDEEEEKERKQQKRGRSGRASSFSYSSANSGRKGSRSMSPLRASDSDVDVDVSEDFSQTVKGISSSTSNPKSSSYASFLSSISFTKGYRKWRLKDFLLFRSASEGRAGGKDPLRKYAVLSKQAATATAEEEVRNSSFRSTESSSSASWRRRGPVSAHELHYTVNRAASEELKKKTVLPYKQLGPLGCLGFNHEVSRGIRSLTR